MISAIGMIYVKKNRLGTRIVVGDAVPLQVRWNRKVINTFKTISTQINGFKSIIIENTATLCYLASI